MIPWCNRHPYLFTLAVWAVLASALLWVSVAHAQLTPSYIFGPFLTVDGGQNQIWSGNYMGNFVTLPDADPPEYIAVMVDGDVTPDTTWHVRLYTAQGTAPNEIPDTLLCSSETKNTADLPAVDNNNEEVMTMTGCPSLTEGRYVIQVRCPGCPSNLEDIRWKKTTEGTDGGNNYDRFFDGTWNSIIGDQIGTVAVYTLTSGPTPTPTPTAEPNNYEYLTTVRAILATTAADQTDVAVQFPINALNLVDAGYLDTGAQGLLVVQDNDVVLPTVHAGVNAASWWIPFLGDTSPGQTRSADLYTSPNPTPLRPQSLWLENASESADVVHDASFDITSELTIEVDAVEARTLPTAPVCLLCKTDQWEITLDGATLTADIETAAGTETLTHTGIQAGTSYNVKVTFDDGDELALFVDNDPKDSRVGLSTTLATTANDIETALFPGWVGRARVGDTSVSSPAYVLDLQFEPTHLTQTDAGDAGDGWTWEGTIEDQSASGNDATYLFVRDMSIWTTEVDPISSNEDLPPALTNNELANLFDAPNIATGTTDDILTGDDTLEQLVESPGLTSSGAWFLFVSLIVIGGGGTLLVRVSQQAVVGVLFGGFALFGAGALGWLGWIWVTLGCFILVIGMSAVLWLRR